jgi:hypothetical protein
MISDVLADAEDRIQEYLDDPAYADAYAEVRSEIERVMAAMKALREKLDRAPQ